MKIVFDFASQLGIEIKDPRYLCQALIHSSYAHETGNGDWQNERLEFLGDSILGFAISFMLYCYFPLADEGELTKYKSILVSENTLFQIAQEHHLENCVRLGKGERLRGGNIPPSILASTYEAVLGAVFLDLGYKEAMKMIQKDFELRIKEVSFTQKSNPKGELQEYLQKNLHTFPLYRVTKTEGPPHNRIFYVEVFAGKKILGSGTGKSKREAEQKAATTALSLLFHVSNPT